MRFIKFLCFSIPRRSFKMGHKKVQGMYLRLIVTLVLAYLPTDKTLALHRLQYAAPVTVIHKHRMQVPLSIGFVESSNLRDLSYESDFNNTFYTKMLVPQHLSWLGGNHCKFNKNLSSNDITPQKFEKIIKKIK